MKTELFEALDAAVKAEGKKLSAKELGGNAIAEELKKAGYVEDGKVDKKKSLVVTEKGKKALEHEQTPERVDGREKSRKHALMVQFLAAIEKSGKLSGKDKAAIPEATIEEAKTKRLIAPGKKPDSYELQPGGETVLFGRKPLDEQVAALKKTNDQLVARVHGAHLKAKESLEPLQGDGVSELKSALEAIESRSKAAAEEFTKVLGEIAAFSTIAGAAARFQSVLEESRTAAVRQLHAEAEQAKSREAESKQLITSELRKIDEEMKHLAERIAATEAKAAEALKATPASVPHPKAESHPKPEPQSSSTDHAIWETTKKEFETLHAETARMGGIVKIPELTDAVRKHYSDLTPEHFHHLLQEWGKAGKLTLQHCSTTDKEPRSSEGIHSPTGLLFYIVLTH